VLTLAATYATAQTVKEVPATGAAAVAIAYARSQLDVPYVWGGQSPGVAWGCSGLVQAAYAAAGIHLPRVAQDQYNAGPHHPGDLIF